MLQRKGSNCLAGDPTFPGMRASPLGCFSGGRGDDQAGSQAAPCEAAMAEPGGAVGDTEPWLLSAPAHALCSERPLPETTSTRRVLRDPTEGSSDGGGAGEGAPLRPACGGGFVPTTINAGLGAPLALQTLLPSSPPRVGCILQPHCFWKLPKAAFEVLLFYIYVRLPQHHRRVSGKDGEFSKCSWNKRMRAG